MRRLRNRNILAVLVIVCAIVALARIGFSAVSTGTANPNVVFSAVTVMNSGSQRVASTNYSMFGVLGQSLAALTYGPNMEAHFGIFPGGIVAELAPSEYEITGIQAFSSSVGQEVLEKTWQKYNDIYFSWRVTPNLPTSLILGYSVSLDSSPDETIDTTMTYYDGFVSTPLAEGTHTFYVKAATSGDVWGDTASFEFWIDNREPTAANLSPTPGILTTQNPPTISFSISDAQSGLDADSLKLYIDGNSTVFTYSEGSVSATPEQLLPDGMRNIRIQAKDLAGNLLDQSWGFTIDAKPPKGSIVINGGDESTNFARVRLNLAATDDISQVTQMILSNDGLFDNEIWEDYVPLRTDWILDEPQKIGPKKVYCKFKDEAGNISTIYQDTIILLSAAIDTIITTGPYSPTQSTSAEFIYQSSFPDAVFSYKLDNQDWSFWSPNTSASFSGLAAGNHVFSVKSAKDANADFIITEDEEDVIPAQWTWVIQGAGKAAEEEEKVLYWRTE